MTTESNKTGGLGQTGTTMTAYLWLNLFIIILLSEDDSVCWSLANPYVPPKPLHVCLTCAECTNDLETPVCPEVSATYKLIPDLADLQKESSRFLCFLTFFGAVLQLSDIGFFSASKCLKVYIL